MSYMQDKNNEQISQTQTEYVHGGKLRTVEGDIVCLG